MKSTAFLILVLFFAANPTPASSQDFNPRELFSRAHDLYSQKHFAEAKEMFFNTLDPDFPLEDYSLYYLGSIYLNEGNREAAYRLFGQLRERYPSSLWFHQAELQRAKILVAERNYPQALEALRELRARTGGKSELSHEALHLTAQILEVQGDVSGAFAKYQELRDLSPLSRWAAAARRDVNRLRQNQPSLFGLDTPEALANEAERLTKEREIGEAEKLYRQALSNKLPSRQRSSILMGLAHAYLAVRRRSEAMPVLTEIVRQHPSSPEVPNALYRLAQILWNRNDNSKALTYFQQLLEQHPGSSYLDLASFAVADIFESQKKKDEAIAIYASFPKRFPGSRLRGDAIWRLAWLYYLEKDFSRAHTTFRSLAAHGADERYHTAALFWQARTAEKLGKAEESVRLFLQIVNAEEDSYYKGPSARRLEAMGVALAAPADPRARPTDESDPLLTADLQFHLLRARELAQLDLHGLAVAELDEINRLARREHDLIRLLMREYARNRAYNRSVALANQIPNASDERDRHRYPLAYWGAIQQKAQEKQLDPFLIVSLVRQESLFEPRARSPASALGLMQLLPSTAAQVAKQLGLPTPSMENLFDPELNLTLGMEYLKDLLERHQNNWVKAIAAYNAGERALARWENEIITDDEEEFIERIPYTETRLYVKLILRNYRSYRNLYHTQR